MKKLLIALYLIFCVGFWCLWISGQRNVDGSLVFFGGVFFWGVYSALFGVFYWIVKLSEKFSADMDRLLYCEKYDELKEKYGPILKETVVDIKYTKEYYLHNELSICKEALFLTDARGRSICVPYLQYAICKKNELGVGEILVIVDIMPMEIAAETFLVRDLYIRFLDSKDIDFILSLVQQAREKIATK